MNKTGFDKHTNLEKQALMLATLLTSYSPESALANLTPTAYAMFFARAMEIMQAVGITPEPNIRCWFWQLDTYMTGRNNEKRLRAAREKVAPILNYGLQRWVAPSDGHELSEHEFRFLWPN